MAQIVCYIIINYLVNFLLFNKILLFNNNQIWYIIFYYYVLLLCIYVFILIVIYNIILDIMYYIILFWHIQWETKVLVYLSKQNKFLKLDQILKFFWNIKKFTFLLDHIKKKF